MRKGENKLLVAKAEYNYYPEIIEKPKPKQVNKKRKKVRTFNKNMYISIAIILFVTNLFVLGGYAKITEKRLEITQLENQVAELEKEKLNLEANLEALKSTTMISEMAIDNLGMIYPEEGQIVYIAIDDNDGVEIVENNMTEKLKEVFNNFQAFFKGG